MARSWSNIIKWCVSAEAWKMMPNDIHAIFARLLVIRLSRLINTLIFVITTDHICDTETNAQSAEESSEEAQSYNLPAKNIKTTCE